MVISYQILQTENRIYVQYGTKRPIILGMDDIFSFLFLWISYLRKDTDTYTEEAGILLYT